MRYNLSDIDRTLLSAYLDGELSAAEVTRAEALLASSEGARNYLHELRAVGSLSSQAFAMPVAVAGAGVPLAGAFAGKLSGSAIQAAAQRAVLTKGVAAGSWGVAGIVGTVAAVAVGVALSMQNPKPVQNPSRVAREHHNVASQLPVTNAVQANEGAQSVVSLDTNNLMVPPMTTSDLLAFAVHGTLPIDAKRSRFITLASKGKDSLTVRVHSKAPEDVDQAAESMNFSEVRMLDSIQRVIRTSVLHAKQGIALRADIPSLRLSVIRSFEQAAPRMPMYIRERLDRTRIQLAPLAAMLDTPSDASGPVAASEGQQIVYRMIPAEGLFTDGRGNIFAVPTEIVLDFDNEPFFSVDQHMLRAFQSQVRVQMPDVPESADVVPEEPHHALISPAGIRTMAPRKRAFAATTTTTTTNTNCVIGSPVGTLVQSGSGTSISRSNNGVLSVRIQRNDSLMYQANDAVREAEARLRRVDSLFRELQKKVEQQMQLQQNQGHGQVREGQQDDGGQSTGTGGGHQ